MNQRDETLRGRVNDALTAANIDVRNLAIEVSDGHVFIKGTVPSREQRARMASVVGQCVDRATPLECEVGVREVAPSDSVGGRGRSPLTGTSADSAHESRHQLDRD
ncbi:MAG TPA: BON domain-containing protein [Reyranella sp.]|nr:BON domain-containing protein [Reyranella sp.]